MRKLASIQRIISLAPITGADKIEKATILGWEVVVKKDDFKINDLCIYCEIDSILPDKPEFEFLRERKFRIKTIKLKGQISQGICFPMSILPYGVYPEDCDVTDILGIKKHDPQALLEQKELDLLNTIKRNRLRKFFMRYPWYRRLIFKPSKLSFPAWIKKTDEDRIQLFPNICSQYKGVSFQVTEKIDGQSGTFFIIKNNKKWFWQPKYLFGVCSRNFQLLKQDGQSYWEVANRLNLKQRLMEIVQKCDYESLVLQGEIIGSKIQGNKYNVEENQLYVFNVIINSKRLDNIGGNLWCRTHYFNFVPIITNNFVLPETIHEVVETAKGKSLLCDVLREGLVLRDYSSGFSCKVINPDFLLKFDE